MAIDMFIKIGDIKGESVDAKHKDEIEVLSWNWGVNHVDSTHVGSGAGAGKVSVHDLTFSKRIDIASPKLVLACCEGRHLADAVLAVRRAGKTAFDYFTISMKDVVVTVVLMEGSDDGLTESVSIRFNEVTVKYTPQDKTGKAGTAVAAGWNVAKNKKL